MRLINFCESFFIVQKKEVSYKSANRSALSLKKVTVKKILDRKIMC